MSVTRGTPEGVYGELNPQDLRDMAKAERLQARLQWLIAGPLITTSMQGQRRQEARSCCLLDAHGQSFEDSENLPTAGRRGVSSHTEWSRAVYVTLERRNRLDHGITYGARALW